MKVLRLFFVIFFVSVLFPDSAFATCGFTSYQSFKTYTANLNTVYVQRDTPVGTTLLTMDMGSLSPGYSNVYICDTPWSFTWELLGFTQPSAISKVYNTNISGIGIQMTWSNNGSTYDVPGTVSYNGNSALAVVHYTISLVKTSIGGVGAGSLNMGPLSRVNASSGTTILQVNMGASNIIPVACSISTPNLLFPIGDVLASKFGTTIGTLPSGAQNTQNLGLNCDAQANINVSLSGTQNPDVGTTSVLALTGQGGADVAKGVGVQILYNGSPLVLNNRIVLKRSSGGQETFPLTARYYQTKTSVTTGTANASATLNLTYQ